MQRKGRWRGPTWERPAEGVKCEGFASYVKLQVECVGRGEPAWNCVRCDAQAHGVCRCGVDPTVKENQRGTINSPSRVPCVLLICVGPNTFKGILRQALPGAS